MSRWRCRVCRTVFVTAKGFPECWNCGSRDLQSAHVESTPPDPRRRDPPDEGLRLVVWIVCGTLLLIGGCAWALLR